MKKKQSEKGDKNTDNYYVNPKEFGELIQKFYNTDVLSDELVLMASKIAYRLAYRPNFINYTYRDDMIGDAVIKIVAALQNKKFNHEKGNPFSYFTKIAINAFRNRIKKEKKQHDAVTAYQEEMYNELMDNVMNSRKIRVHSENIDESPQE
jgi:DNA-directed RNA polymerase specialized sigma24 family protein